MAAPTTASELLELVRKSGVVDTKRLDPHLEKLRSAGTLPSDPAKLAGLLIRDGLLTQFQAEQLMLGKWRRFTIGKYKVLERLGQGGMGSVYLCEHKLMRRRVAIKVLPTAKSQDEASLGRFYREARAVAALDHPNIVHAYDIDQDETLHFLVMEYVDGSSLQDIVKKGGPLDPSRAAHYISQAAQGLQHALDKGLVHRDIKPGNLLVDRSGTVKILDMGLARFFNDEEDILTRKFDENVLGTADYLAPEQAVDSHEVDARADIYSLGGTFYYLLTGRTPFGEGTVAQKLIWHQTRQPRPISSFRNDVPAEMEAIIEKMMAKQPDDRFQKPLEVVEALLPWTKVPIAPPPESEMPRLSPAVMGCGPSGLTPALSSGMAETTQGFTAHTPIIPEAAARRTSQVVTGPRPPLTPTPVAQAVPTTPSPGLAAPAASPEPTLPAPVRKSPNGVSARPTPEPIAEDEWNPEERNASAPIDLGGEAVASPRRDLLRPSQQEKRRLWMVIIGVVGVFSVLAAVLVWRFILNAPPPPPPERKPLEVSRDGRRPGAYPSIQLALASARPGDVIELWDELHEENLVIKATDATLVTLQAAPGKKIVWTCKKGQEHRPLLFLSGAAGFRFIGRNITLDGQNRMSNLIFITLRCPHLTLEEAQFQGFTNHGIQVMNAAGEAQAPIRLVGLRFQAPSSIKGARAIYFDANDQVQPNFNDYIEVEGGQYQGWADNLAIARKDNTVTGRHIKLPPRAGW